MALIQKKAVKIVAEAKEGDSALPLYQKFNTLNAGDIYRPQTVVFMYKLTHGLFWYYFSLTFIIHSKT